MELIFEKNSIQINNKECDLENFKEQEFFAILEQIVNNIVCNVSPEYSNISFSSISL